MSLRSATRLGTLCALAAAMVLSGCNRKNDQRIAFAGAYFKTKAAPVDKKVSLADFFVTVKGVSATLDGARAAGGYEGVKYCITNYGTSDIVWAVGPDTDPAGLTVSNDVLTFRGRCNP